MKRERERERERRLMMVTQLYMIGIEVSIRITFHKIFMLLTINY